MTDRQRFRTKPVIPDHNLFYRRVKFLCIHSSFAGEQNIDLQMSHGTAVRLKKVSSPSPQKVKINTTMA